VCHKFQGDSLAKAIRQHIARHILQSEDDWLRRYNVLKPEFPCMLCGIRDLHGIDLGRDTNAIDLCYMWFESWTSQPTLYCILFQEMKPYGFLASANKSRLKSVRWKDSKSAEPSSNVPIQCPGCKKVFGNNIYINTFPKNTPIWRCQDPGPHCYLKYRNVPA